MSTFKNPMTLEVDCKYCGKTVNLVVEQEDFKKYLNHKGPIQDIFPYLSAGECELILSNTCEDCWDKLFSDAN